MHDMQQEAAITEATGLIVSALVGNPNSRIDKDDIPGLITSIRAAMAAQPAAQPAEELKPAVPVKKSVQPDHIICLEDGKKFKSLKRHLMSHYNMTPQAYREKWGLPADYPMVAPNYAAARSELAKSMGLGRRASETAVVEQKTAVKKLSKKTKG